MKMTPEFAAATASVAPVILLVGLVEMRDMGKRMERRWMTMLDERRALRAELEAGPGEEREAGLTDQLERSGRRSVREIVIPLSLATAWTWASVSLGITTYRSLEYLSLDHPTAAPDTAYSALTWIKFSLVLLVITPIFSWVRGSFYGPVADLFTLRGGRRFTAGTRSGEGPASEV